MTAPTRPSPGWPTVSAATRRRTAVALPWARLNPCDAWRTPWSPRGSQPLCSAMRCSAALRSIKAACAFLHSFFPAPYRTFWRVAAMLLAPAPRGAAVRSRAKARRLRGRHPPRQAGTVLRVRHKSAAPRQCRGVPRHRSLNRHQWRPIAVSGTVIYPDGPPEGAATSSPGRTRRPVWPNATRRRCFPIYPARSPASRAAERGYVVVATDYEGLGLLGVHAISSASARRTRYSISVRAARTLQQRARHRALSSGAIRRAGAPRCSAASWRPTTRPN